MDFWSQVDDAILVSDFLRRRGRNLVELDLKSNRLECKALAHILVGLRLTTTPQPPALIPKP